MSSKSYLNYLDFHIPKAHTPQNSTADGTKCWNIQTMTSSYYALLFHIFFFPDEIYAK